MYFSYFSFVTGWASSCKNNCHQDLSCLTFKYNSDTKQCSLFSTADITWGVTMPDQTLCSRVDG